MVCDTKNHLIREINLHNKTVRKIVGKAGERGFDTKGGKDIDDQSIASPWDIIQIKEQQYMIAMAGTH